MGTNRWNEEGESKFLWNQTNIKIYKKFIKGQINKKIKKIDIV